MEMTDFTWKTSEGTEFEVYADFDVDNWTGREMRAVEHICGSFDGTGMLATTSMVLAVSIARTVPGYTIQSADQELTLGRVSAILKQLQERRKGEIDDNDAGTETAEDGAEVLSPTKPDAAEGDALT
jgi:hypothetical protein